MEAIAQNHPVVSKLGIGRCSMAPPAVEFGWASYRAGLEAGRDLGPGGKAQGENLTVIQEERTCSLGISSCY